MIPWFLFWSPHITFPFGGSVNQKIEPDTNWFFNAIPPQAGNAQVEKRAFEIASYGHQLGLMMKLLQDLCQQLPPTTDEGKTALCELAEIQEQISIVKASQATSTAKDMDDLIAHITKLPNKQLTQLQQAIEKTLTDS